MLRGIARCEKPYDESRSDSFFYGMRNEFLSNVQITTGPFAWIKRRHQAPSFLYLFDLSA